MKTIFAIFLFLLFKISIGQVATEQMNYSFEALLISPDGNDLGEFSVKIEPHVTIQFKKNAFSFQGYGKYDILISVPGYRDFIKQVYLSSDTTISIELLTKKDVVNIHEVNIIGKQWKNSIKLKGTLNSIDRETLEKMPSFLGEKDFIRALQSMPGVSIGNEGSAELQIRGGTTDQNLIMLDGIPLYNSTHLFGMYSAFNPLVVENVQLYTGAFPSSFGGKISSVIDVKSRDANFNKPSGSLEIGLTSLKGHLELPILKKKLSLLLAARRSFFETLTMINQSSNKEYFNYFDLNGILTYKPYENHVIKFSSYIDGDHFNYIKKGTDIEKDGLRKSQQAFSLNWKGLWNSNISSDIIAFYTNYNNSLFEQRQRQQNEESYNNNFRSKISNLGFKAIFRYSPISNINISGGIDNITYFTDPSTLYGDNNGENFFKRNVDKDLVNELSPHAQVSFQRKGTNIDLGARFSYFDNKINSNGIFEPRISLFQRIGKDFSVKVAYSKMSQPIQRLSNPGLGMPLEIIYPGHEISKPQTSDIFSITAARDFYLGEESSLSLAIEAYDKSTKNILSFRDGYDTRSIIYYAFGAIYRSNSINEMVLSDGVGRSKGIELKLDLTLGRLYGWMNYSLSKSDQRFSLLNGGEWFPSQQDRRHILNSMVGWKINEKWRLSLSWTFSSGQAITLPEYFYPLYSPFPDNSLVHSPNFLYSYGKRNSSRMIPFHKLDISFTKKTRAFGCPAEFNFGVYNIYNRKNPSFYYLGDPKNSSGLPELRSLSVFPIMPSVSLKIDLN